MSEEGEARLQHVGEKLAEKAKGRSDSGGAKAST